MCIKCVTNNKKIYNRIRTGRSYSALHIVRYEIILMEYKCDGSTFTCWDGFISARFMWRAHDPIIINYKDNSVSRQKKKMERSPTPLKKWMCDLGLAPAPHPFSSEIQMLLNETDCVPGLIWQRVEKTDPRRATSSRPATHSYLVPVIPFH